MPAPPHPGRGGGPGKGPPLHRCCHPRPTGTAIGVEVGPQGPTRPGTQNREDCCSLARTLVRAASGLALFLGCLSARPRGWKRTAQRGARLPLGAAEGLGYKPGAGCCVKCNKEARPSRSPSGVRVLVSVCERMRCVAGK